MQLSELQKYNPVTIQCHDNPDADSIGAGYGLYCYFKDLDKDVHLVYTGRNQISKSNLRLLVDTLEIPIEYLPMENLQHRNGLLITVDCQYGAGNVTKLSADYVAVIDHHPVEILDLETVRIQPTLGSCATLVWSMLKEAKYEMIGEERLGTALYYGLFTDTNQFSELSNPLDMDMRESVTVNKQLMSRYRNANLSLKELEIAGIALIRYNYNYDYRFAVIKAQPCDPNILGLISDFLLQVDEIDTCVVYNDGIDGYKLSVRSCIKEVNANEMAAFLTEGIGSGGGHIEKAGGFISKTLYEKKYPTLHSEAYFNNRMTEYFDSYEIIYAKDVEMTPASMEAFRRTKRPMGYLQASELLAPGTRVAIRNHEGSMDMVLAEDTFFTMEQDGTIHSMSKEIFDKYHLPLEGQLPEDYCEKAEYIPMIKEWDFGASYLFSDYAKLCVPKDEFCIYAKKLDKRVKIFPKWNDEKYLLGMPGDYLAVSCDDLHNIYIEPGYDFLRNYEKMQS